LNDIVNNPPPVPDENVTSAATSARETTVAPVASFGDFQWPPPRDWQKFERICHLLWRKIWKDPKAQLNGRPGQAQQGVDVFGTPEGKTRVHGIQCKRKDALLHTMLKEDEVRAEVGNAKAFQPPLEELVIATCALSDASLQALARKITAEHAEQGLFRVDVMGWTEIVERMAEHPEVIAQVYGVERIRESRDTVESPRAETRHTELISGQVNIQQQLAQIAAQLTAPAEGPAHAKLDVSRELIQSHEYRPALELLERLREQEWPTASASVRFRIATNLGAAHVGLGEYAKAGDWYVQAFAFDPTSDKALANRALGLLLLDQRNEALTAACEAVDQYPNSPLTWKAYLNVLTRVEPQTSLPEIPAALADDPDVLFLRGDSLAMQRRWSDAEAVFRRVIALPLFDVMAKSRLADVILTQTTGGRFYGGVPYSPSELARLKEALTLLDETWSSLKSADRAASLHVLQNACALRAVLGLLREAESSVDEGLVVAPNAPGLLAWKIRIAGLRGDGVAALRALERLSPETLEEYPVIAATAYRAAKEPGRAADALEEFIRGGAPDPNVGERDPELFVNARCMFADLVCEADLPHAEARFDALPDAGTPGVAGATVIFARALREMGRSEAAERYLAAARGVLVASDNDRDRLLLADALAEFEQYEAAVAIYEGDVATGTDTPSLREYIRCLLELDQRRRLTDLFAALTPELRRKTHYEWARANLCLRSGDYPAARAALERCLAIEPDHFITRLLWAEVCVRLDDPNPARDWLATVNIRAAEQTLDHHAASRGTPFRPWTVRGGDSDFLRSPAALSSRSPSALGLLFVNAF
jgi:tetratricopeptide (TPR) repeat protein